MKRKRHTPEQIIRKLREADGLSGSLGKRVQVAVGNANDAIRRVLGGTTLGALAKKK